jgi:glucosamine kinase
VSFFMGIDGGGSKTRCVVGDEKSILGSGEAGPSNVLRVGEEKAREAIRTAITLACAEAKSNPWEIQRTCIGIAGGARAEIAGPVETILSEIVGGEIEVVGDMVIALAGAFGVGPGVIVIAGTGSIAYGRNGKSETARAGGWGFAISDEGSAHWIGRAAVSAVMRAYDKGRESSLMNKLMAAWHVESRERMVMAANAVSADFAGLLPTIHEAAKSGDEIAHVVLRRAGRELAMLAATVITRIYAPTEDVQVAIAGGVFRNVAEVRQVFYHELRSLHPQIKAVEEIVDPVQGALTMARKGLRAGTIGAH